ncbi:hypothetical protein [Tuberibacillus calidus]|jgi:hypothetical protein|uniref:hypothetical protein n=1 Tax=Tuberibacillus calidus TaxID=340097 RepID=UPI000414CE03|nr:hypothetical protein [Tuberibacillus calidus]
MIKAILDYLTGDKELRDLVGYTPKNQRIREYIPKNRTDYPYIIFEVFPLLAGNPVTQYRCDLTILTQDVVLTEAIANRLLELLHFNNKPGFIIDGKSIYHSTHSGGSGINYDPDQKIFEQILSFNILAD